MNKGQYGEPWRFDATLIYEDDGSPVPYASRPRIVACVNALAGKNPDALARFVFQAKMALGVLEAGPDNLRVSARALRKAMEDFGRETP